MAQSLAEFAKEHPTRSGPKCWLCGLLERAEVEEARKQGVPMTVIADWLRNERGYAESTLAKIKGHFYQHPRGVR